MLIRANKQVWLLLLCGLMTGLMLSLGTWQLGRADEKRKWQAAMMQPKVYQSDWLDHIVDGNLLKVVGHYLPERQFLIDNKVVNGVPSYDVVTPFLASDGTLFFVNRGAVPARSNREQLPTLSAIDALEASLLIRVYAPSKSSFRLSDAQYATAGWPKRVQYYDADYFTQVLATGQITVVFPTEVRLEPQQLGVLTRHWHRQVLSPEKHVGYAFQWFAMAGTLMVLVGYYRYKKKL
ncbi:SURF1 family protein [Marinomonas aquimarina]|uniref:SURF1-like protein n=1 Tax=Marinomonas aquimarina TaxID=295068 RepID=A0A1A8TRZ4_9GAMM|nr:SURF1 family protein [Marinomonas aquimarina]SBS36310.1 SURF1 family protein [Marinomonas aquimarina]